MQVELRKSRRLEVGQKNGLLATNIDGCFGSSFRFGFDWSLSLCGVPGEPTPGENGGGDSVLGATRVFVSGSVQLGKNLGEFSLGSGVYAGTQFSDPIFNASGGWHRGMQNGAPQTTSQKWRRLAIQGLV